MHEFDRCNFCATYVEGDGDVFCIHPYCVCHSDYSLDISKVLKKADEMNLTVTDVLNLMREANN